MAEFNINNVEREIQNWIFGYLDQPSEYYGGSKPCPFAAKAWVNAKVTVTIGGPEMVDKIAQSWSDDYDLRIVAVDPSTSWPGMEQYCDVVNPRLVDRDLVLIPFVPSKMESEDPASDPERWGRVIEKPYAMVFVQRLSKLNDFSRLLEGQGYYKNVPSETLGDLKQRRESEKKHGNGKQKRKDGKGNQAPEEKSGQSR